MRASKHKRKRERQKRKYALRPKVKPIAAISTKGLIAELAQPLHTIAFREVLEASNKN